MKEHYATYDQAVKLKELGFDWECHNYFARNAYDWKMQRWRRDIPFDHNTHDGVIKEICSAPTLAMAQAWLRNCKGISVEPYCNMVRQWNVSVCMIEEFGETVWSKIGLETYELALSAGIDAALELLTDKCENK